MSWYIAQTKDGLELATFAFVSDAAHFWADHMSCDIYDRDGVQLTQSELKDILRW